jgi:hypothetical protein
VLEVRRFVAEYGLFVALALAIIGWFFRDAWMHGYVLGQTDLLFDSIPWKPYRPLGWRARMPLLSDAAVVVYPFVKFAKEAIGTGHFPTWSAAMGGGRPFFAAFQSAVLSPFTLADYALPFPWSLSVDAALRLLTGGVGMYALLRGWRLSIGSAVFGGVAYLLNPFSVVWLEHPVSAVAAWVPWLLVAIDRSIEGADARGVGFVGLATAAALLSGHPETAFNAILFASAYACVRSAQAGEVRRLLLVAGGITLGAAVAAVQLVPFVEYALHSRALGVRSAVPLATPPQAFAAAIVPDFYGHPLRHRFVLGGTNYAAQEAYPGLIVWLCAPLALLHRRLRAKAIFLLAAAVAGFLIMYGTPVAFIFRRLIPPLRLAAPWSLAWIPVAALGMSAAIGLDAAFGADSPPVRRRVIVPILVIATGTVLAFAVWLSFSGQRDLLIRTSQSAATINAIGRGAAILLCAVVVLALGTELPRRLGIVLTLTILSVDLLLFGDGLHPLTPPAYAYPPVPELSYLHDQPGVFRVSGWRLALPPNSAMVYGLQDVRSYDGVGLSRYDDVLELGFYFNGTAFELINLGTPQLIDFLNVKYIVAPADEDLPPDRFRLAFSGGSRVYENRRVQERAFLADRFVIARGDDARRLLRQGTDLTTTAILEEHLAPEFRPDAAHGGVGSATITHYENDRAVIQTIADGRRLLVMSDVYYPGWTVTIDGRAAPILVANYAFRAVSVPPGSHTVRFRYQPNTVMYGALVSLIAVVGALVMVQRSRD